MKMMRSVFPCGDSMVAIIDDREDIWGRCPNLIHVKPYIFFAGTTDINAPPPHSTKPRPPHPKQSGGARSGLRRKVRPEVTRHRRMRTQSHAAAAEKQNSSGMKSSGMECETVKPERSVAPLGPGDIVERSTDEPTATQSDVTMASPSVSPSLPAEVATSVEIACISNNSDDSNDITEQEAGDGEGVTSNDSSLDGSGSNNNNNNNNNNSSGAEPEVEAVEESSDSGSDSDSSSSSSGIDDTLPVDHALDQPCDGGVATQVGVATSTPGNESGSQLQVVSGGNDGTAHETTSQPDQPAGGGMTETATHAELAQTPPTTCVAPPLHTPASEAEVVGESQSRGKRKIRDADDFLLHLVDILERIHDIFYDEYDHTTAADPDPPIPDLKQIIPALRHSILSDCRILFTGVIPTNIPTRKNREWNTARAFGATVHTHLVPGLSSSNETDVQSATTHVIAGKPGTTKLQEARRMPGVKVVTPKWLWACAERWKQVDEQLYPMRAEKQGRREDVVAEREVPKVAAAPRKDNPNGVSSPRKPEAMRESASDSDCEEGDNIFKNSSYAKLANMDTNELKRHLSIESRLSVSDEELGRMDAEVDAEISSSNEGSVREKKEGLGSHLEMLVDNEDEISYEKFAGTDASQDIDAVERLNRKRSFADIEASSSSDSLLVEHLNESFVSDNDLCEDDSGDDGDDELGALLGF